MTSVNQNSASIIPLNSGAEKLKELEKARLISSDIYCIFDFIDCRELIDTTEGDPCSVELSREHMKGVFLAVDSIIAGMIKIKKIVGEHGQREDSVRDICHSIDNSLAAINLAVRLAKIRFAGDCVDYVRFDEIWITGFFGTLSYAFEISNGLFHAINELCLALKDASQGDGNAENSLH